ncbi:hypothetical protein BGW39_001773 [Mortierella sp. 14UC]|nr:hypothetical protein BGW39_001773 [Mortierella sp. 14UC]
MATPEPEHYAFVDLLFERLLFERILMRNQTTGCCISPGALSMQLDLIGHYYTAIAMTTFQRLCGEAIRNRDFSNWGILSCLSNHQRRPFKIFPNSLAAKFDLEIESDRESKLRDHIFCPWMSHKQVKDFRKDYASKVSKDHQREFEFLVDMLDQNGLLRAANCDTEPEFLSRKTEKVSVDEIPLQHVENLMNAHTCTDARVIQEASLLHSIKTLTSLEPVLLSSSANGVNISDCDVEILLLAPETAGDSLDTTTPNKLKAEFSISNTSVTTKTGKRSASKKKPSDTQDSTLTMKDLASLLTKGGYKSVRHLDRYFDPSSEINVDYLFFIDPRSELACQITLDHPLGIKVRDLLLDYANIDTRVEPLIFAVQQTLDDFGRCRQYLSNYAVALMTIAFLQTKKVLPLLQRHVMLPASPTQPSPTATSKPSGNAQSPASIARTNSRHRQYFKRDPLSASSQIRQPRKGQQDNSPVSTKSQIRNQKRKDKKRLHREQTLPAATVKVKTVSGGTRLVDCRYDKVLTQTRPFDNRTTRESVAELLTGFMDYFGYCHRSTQCEISVILGSTTFPVAIPDAATGSNSTPAAPEKDCTCLVVRDPFVTDRNVTWLCSQWRLSHCERMFMRAIMFLEGLGVESDFDDDDDHEDHEDDRSGMESDIASADKDATIEETFAGYDGDDDDEEDLSDNEMYPIEVPDALPVDELIDQLASISLMALLSSAPGQSPR